MSNIPYDMASFCKSFKNKKDQKRKVNVIVDRNMLDEEGRPFKWVIRELSMQEVENISKQHSEETDKNLWLMMAAVAVEFPEVRNMEFLRTIGVGSPYQAICDLTSDASSRSALTNVIIDLHGFNMKASDLIEEIKN